MAGHVPCFLGTFLLTVGQFLVEEEAEPACPGRSLSSSSVMNIHGRISRCGESSEDSRH